MKAWQLDGVHDLNKNQEPLIFSNVPVPAPVEDEIVIRISCCGICHTELDEIEGRTPPPVYPIIPGHQVVGRVELTAPGARRFKVNDRVGVAWIFSSCGTCEFCRAGLENLCAKFTATGRDAHGGYAEYMKISENFAYRIPAAFNDEEAAPLLCAGAIGFRSLRLARLEDGQVLGLTGFGASGHLVLKMARYLYPKSKVIVFARSADEQRFALSLGAIWAGDTSGNPTVKPQAIIDTTPVWKPIVESLRHLEPGGRLVINAIRKESHDQRVLLDLDYSEHLWMEKEIKSVANITRKDVDDFLLLAARIPIKPKVEIYQFADANKALVELKHKHVNGAKVLRIS